MARVGRDGRDWYRARAWVFATYSACWICQRPVDFDAPARSRWSPSVDHVFPVSAMRSFDRATQERMAVDRSNLRLAHYGCNSARGNRPPRQRVEGSRQW